MVDVVYTIVEHDGGWAYKAGDVFSETFPDRAVAESAADRVAALQRVPGESEAISWEDEQGRWHDETASGSDRPNTAVQTGSMPGRSTAAPPSPRDRRPASAARTPLSKDPIAAIVVAGILGMLLVTLLSKGRHDTAR